MEGLYDLVVLGGGPGVGKGTQAALLERPHAHHFSSGEAFRAQEDSPLAQRYADTLAKGDAFPDDVAMQLLRQECEQRGYTPGADLLLLDGVPFTKGQVSALRSFGTVRHVLYLRADDDLLCARMKARGERNADTRPELRRRRIAQWHERTRPAIEAYADEPVPYTVFEADDTKAGLHAKILRVLWQNDSLRRWYDPALHPR